MHDSPPEICNDYNRTEVEVQIEAFLGGYKKNLWAVISFSIFKRLDSNIGLNDGQIL